MTRRRAIHLAAVLLLLHAGSAVLLTADPLADDPYARDPVLRELLDAATFHHTFDHASLLPDMSAGKWQSQRLGEPQLAPGLRGQALVAGSGGLVFPDPANWTLTTRGSLAVWVSPVTWNHSEAGNTNIVLSASSAFYLERQGPLPKPDGGWLRLEALLVGLQRDPKGSVGAECQSWRPGQWHLLAVNWAWPQLALSVDGGTFQATQLPGKPDPALFGGLVVSSPGGDPTLLDELLCFNRPLSDEEVRRLFERLRPGDEPTPTAGGTTP